jgi:hypothetical protein
MGGKLRYRPGIKDFHPEEANQFLLFGYKSSADEESSLSNSKVYAFADLRQN